MSMAEACRFCSSPTFTRNTQNSVSGDFGYQGPPSVPVGSCSPSLFEPSTLCIHSPQRSSWSLSASHSGLYGVLFALLPAATTLDPGAVLPTSYQYPLLGSHEAMMTASSASAEYARLGHQPAPLALAGSCGYTMPSIRGVCPASGWPAP